MSIGNILVSNSDHKNLAKSRETVNDRSACQTTTHKLKATPPRDK